MKTNKTTLINKAPLPFQGQKRNWASQFCELIKNLDPSITTVVDVFGGSGLLSAITKQTRPDLRVVYNDFDDFRERVKKIPRTNQALEQLRALLADVPALATLTKEQKTAVLDLIREDDDVETLSQSLLFSGSRAKNKQELSKKPLYNRIRKTNIQENNDFFKNIEVQKKDFRETLKNFDAESTLFILDPPYIQTEQAYQRDNYFKFFDQLNLLDLIHDKKYFYFSSDKSELESIKDDKENKYFNNVNQVIKRKVQTTHNNFYIDILFIKTEKG